MEDNQLLIETELNNTFSIDVVEKTLNELKNTSFNYLRDLQHDLMGYKRFDFKMKDFELVTSIEKMNYTIPRKFIKSLKENFISEKNRIAYKKSNLYNSELSTIDIANNPDLFEYNVVMFINGLMFTGFNVYCKEEDTFIVLNTKDPNGLTKTEIENFQNNDYDATVLFIPNSTIGNVNTNGNVLKLNSNYFDMLRFILINPDEKVNFIGGVSIEDSKCLFKTLSIESFSKYMKINYAFDDYVNKPASLSIFGFKYNTHRIVLEPGTKLFDLPLTNMPISTDNLLFFKMENGVETFLHNVKTETYFPNVCELIGSDPSDTIVVYVFYYNSISNELVYDNEILKYLEFYKSFISKYDDERVGQILLNYKPLNLMYGVDDFAISQYYPDHFKYKVEKMREIVKKYPFAFKKYIQNQIEKYHSYYMDMSKLNLSEKLRNNNHTEITNIVKREIFDTPRYVFIFKNKSQLSNDRMRMFIDGILYIPDKVFNENGYDYYYIQQSLIKPNSIIEIEIFDSMDFSWEKTFKYLSDNIQIINDTDKRILASHVYLTDLESNKFIDDDKFKIFYYKGTNMIELEKGSNKTLPKEFYIKLTDPSLLNKPIRINTTKYFFYATKKASFDGNIIQFTFDTTSKFNNKNIRIFRNGRILPMSVLALALSNEPFGKSYATMSMVIDKNDSITFDYTPYRYNLVFTSPRIQSNGFIDLRGNINKPFDLKWFDIYLNGKKLTYHHIDEITPYILRLKNVESTRHLYIYEKDRDIEYFNPTDPVEDTMAKLIDLDTQYKEDIDNRYPEISDIEYDIIGESVNKIILEMAILKERYLINLFINPDLQQVTSQMIQDVPDLVIDGSNNIFVNPDIAFK